MKRNWDDLIASIAPAGDEVDNNSVRNFAIAAIKRLLELE